ncbi:MAG: flagellar hook protein FlgE [Actinobacteria bacterium]|nr:flagellar hook protein FlgE [Actinomycetota bacterium]
MDRALLAAVSGIDANQTYLDTIGNNIANVNTVGYKNESVGFVDLLTEQIAGATAPGGPNTGAGINPISVGSGVRVGSISNDFTQGSIEQTNQPTDVAIQGNGFLVASQQGQSYYTRAGNLVLDANGNLATSTGALIQGWQANGAGVITTNAPLTPITIPSDIVIPAHATTEITMGGNLPANNGTSSTAYSTTKTAYDSLGNAVQVTLTYTPTATPGQWSLQGTVAGSSQDLWTQPVMVQFDPSTGQLKSITDSDTGTTYNALSAGGQPQSISLPVTNMPSNYTFPTGDIWDINFPPPGSSGALTQFAGQQTAAAVSQDGSAAGTLSSFSIGANGVITGSFSNGRTQAIAEIALASFANPGGLADQGNLLYQATANSGQASVGTAGTGGRGTLLGGSLEESNVDLAKQLTNLIVAQEAYEANTKVVSTADTTLQSLVNMP